jgi:hypothetical protein
VRPVTVGFGAGAGSFNAWRAMELGVGAGVELVGVGVWRGAEDTYLYVCFSRGLALSERDRGLYMGSPRHATPRHALAHSATLIALAHIY